MAITIKDIEQILKNSEYSSAYPLDHQFNRYTNMGVREWYLSNETIKIRTPLISLLPAETSEVPSLKVYTQATMKHSFESIAREIAHDADVEVAIIPSPTLFGSEEIEDNDIFRYLFFVDVENVDDLLDGVKSVENARALLYPYLYHVPYYPAKPIEVT